MKNILKAWLKKNELTPDKNEFTAAVSSMGSINQAGLIDAIREEGHDLFHSERGMPDVMTHESMLQTYSPQAMQFRMQEGFRAAPHPVESDQGRY